MPPPHPPMCVLRRRQCEHLVSDRLFLFHFFLGLQVHSVIQNQNYQVHFFRAYLGSTRSTGVVNLNTFTQNTANVDLNTSSTYGPHCAARDDDDDGTPVGPIETWTEDKPFILHDSGHVSVCLQQEQTAGAACADNDAEFVTVMATMGQTVTTCAAYLAASDNPTSSCGRIGTYCQLSCDACPASSVPASTACADNDAEFIVLMTAFGETNVTSCESFISHWNTKGRYMCGRVGHLCPTTCGNCNTDESDSRARTTDSRCIDSSVNQFASETGGFQFLDNDDDSQSRRLTSPDLHATINETLIFQQYDHSNWMMPIGLSFHPGGTHGESWGSAPLPEVRGYDVIQHFIDGIGVQSDYYRASFSRPRNAWRRYAHRIELTITPELADQAIGGVLHYYSATLAGMSGRIIIHNRDGSRAEGVAAEGTVASADVSPLPSVPNAIDLTCGTFGIENFAPSGSSACTERFLCGDLNTTYEKCIQAIDCMMNEGMRVDGHDTHQDSLATFAQQMIPHHQNAVNMAKTLLNHYKDHSGPRGIDGNLMPTSDRFDTLFEVINGQNVEIQKMKRFLAKHETFASMGYSADTVGSHCAADNRSPPLDTDTVAPATSSDAAEGFEEEETYIVAIAVTSVVLVIVIMVSVYHLRRCRHSRMEAELQTEIAEIKTKRMSEGLMALEERTIAEAGGMAADPALRRFSMAIHQLAADNRPEPDAKHAKTPRGRRASMQQLTARRDTLRLSVDDSSSASFQQRAAMPAETDEPDSSGVDCLPIPVRTSEV